MPEQEPLVILFADISESTRLYEALGNTEAQRLIARCISLLTGVAESYRGQVAKTIGDEVMCVFPNASDATQAAGEMQGGIRKLQVVDELPFGRIQLRVGLHHGPVLIETGDVYGETVNIAARMVKLAKPDQIITTEPTVWKMSDDQRAMTRYVDEQTIAGRLDKMDFYEIIWEVSDLTDLATHEPPRALRTTHTGLSLSCAGQRFFLDEDTPTITIGRSETNALVVPSLLASRQHCEIHLTRGRFVVHDQSVNGTFIRRADGREVSLLRDDHPLSGSGQIGIGEPPGEQEELIILYSCE